MTVAVRNGRRIPGRVKRAATHAQRSRWFRVRGAEDGRLLGVPVSGPAPVEHVTRLVGEGELFHAVCSCGETLTRKPMAERYARGAATRHLNQVNAADAVKVVAA